jgi:hypothetical protein
MSLITPESVWNLQRSLQAKHLSTLSGSRMRYVAKLVMWREVRAGRLGGPLAFFDAT